MDKLKVGVIFGGHPYRHSASAASAREIARHLDPAKYEPVFIGITTDGAWKLCEAGPSSDWENSDCRPVALSPEPSVHGLLVLGRGQHEPIRLDVVFPVLSGSAR